MLHRNTPKRDGVAFGLAATFLILGLSLGATRTAHAQVSAEESAKKLKPAEGLEATLWASEPMVINPTTMDVDSRGRVWITEGLNYRSTHAAGKNFSRIEDADKIKILEDTDGDGRADKVTVFADKIWPIPMGLAVEEKWSKDGKYLGARVYVGNSPDLLVFEDTDGDDKADKREALLTGFGGVDSDHGVHGMVLGQDGKLYFTHGDGCCSYEQDHSHQSRNFDVVDRSGRHVWSDQLANTLRVNRDGTQFEIIADRQRNNYETCLNSFGNIFTSDNDDDGNRGSRVIWVMEGGNYGYRTPGSPRHWGEDVPGIVPKLVGTGNGSPCGVMVYEGDLLPVDYRGAVLEAEAGPRVINAFPLTRKGAAFRTEHKIMLASDDPWFRPVDVTAAPDGSVFVADWYDAGVGGHNFRDQTTGRIYRVAPKGSTAKKVVPDFATVTGLVDALKSPVVATRDVARRLLIDRKAEAETRKAMANELAHGSPSLRARAAWVSAAIDPDPASILPLLKDGEATLREQAVRMLGRDVSRVGKVEYQAARSAQPLAAASHLDALLPLVQDPDPSVRRELILAFRDLATEQVGEALKSLAGSWDGQDRWYLEALGLALKNRESGYLATLLDGNLYGDLNLSMSGRDGHVALPPYFPVDRNEAFISAHDPELPPANPLSKTLGLAWELHRVEVLPMLARIAPTLFAPELRQAVDDVIGQVSDPKAAATLAGMATTTQDLPRKRQLLALLGRKIDGPWRNAQSDAPVSKAITDALQNPETKPLGIALAGATGDQKYVDALATEVESAQATEETRSLAIDALARSRTPRAKAVIEAVLTQATKSGTSGAAAEAAVRALPRFGASKPELSRLMTGEETPLGLRREALRTLATQPEGARLLLAMATEKTLPDVLKTEAATVLRGHSDGGIRAEALKAMPITTAGGKPLPSNGDLIRRDGRADRGREVFFHAKGTVCASCHRVQGQGQWIGPDLSTIGTKYAKDELLRSILNPSAAIGSNYRSWVVALQDGQVLTGLMVEDTPEKLVLKTAEGKRVTIRPSEIESRKMSEVSLMPEGLAQAMQEQELVDLLVYLATLKQPVSIVGQFRVLGPVKDTPASMILDPRLKIAPETPVEGHDGQPLGWQRLTADAEGRADLVPLLGGDATKIAYLLAPVTSTASQKARLVLDTRAEVQVWLGGKPLTLSTPGDGQPRSVDLELTAGTQELMIRVPGGDGAAIVATFVADKPVEFSLIEAKISSR